MKIKFKPSDKEGSPELSVEFEFGKDLDDMERLHGENVTFDNALANMRISLQGVCRAAAKDSKDGKPGKRGKALQDVADAWKPGTRRQAKTKAEKIKEQLAALSPEERKALFAEVGK